MKNSKTPILRFDDYPTYKGGPTILSGGYIHEFLPGHHLQNQWGWVAQHRIVIEEKIGRRLRKGEVTHHIDHVRTNNSPENLCVMSREAHQRHHQKLNAEKAKIPLTDEMVRESLAQNGSIKAAARNLNCSHSTLRNRFPHLMKPYLRRSPTRIDDPEATALVLKYAPDKNVGLREVVSATGISAMTIMRIAERNGIPWVKKSRKGEIHRTYKGKPTARSCVQQTGSA